MKIEQGKKAEIINFPQGEKAAEVVEPESDEDLSALGPPNRCELCPNWVPDGEFMCAACIDEAEYHMRCVRIRLSGMRLVREAKENG
jgi:hypothetical protein